MLRWVPGLLQLTGDGSSRSFLKKREFLCHPRSLGYQVPVSAYILASLFCSTCLSNKENRFTQIPPVFRLIRY